MAFDGKTKQQNREAIIFHFPNEETEDRDDHDVNVEVEEKLSLPEDASGQGHPRGLRFWAIIFTLAISRLMVGVEMTIAATSLPTIAEKLHMGASYVWVQNANALTSAIVSPLLGQLAQLFGRRRLAASVVAVFSLGGLISGASTGGAMLAFGRAVQGAGGGGIGLMTNIIVSDMVPLRDRGNYIALVLTVFMAGASLGPLLGGVLVQAEGAHSWRWVFWLPVAPGVMCLVLMLLFVPVEPAWKSGDDGQQETAWSKLKSIDYVGNMLVMGSTTSALVALTYGGAQYPWSSPQVVIPLALGVAGLIAFTLVEGLVPIPLSPAVAERFTASHPVLPPRLLYHRTGAIVGVNAFLSSLVSSWANFFLSVYFQAVRQSGPALAGLQVLPTVLTTVPVAIVSVWLVSKTGRYKFLHVVGFVAMTLTLTLIGATLDRESSDLSWMMLQIVYAAGVGAVVNTLLPAFQAGVPESDQAAATATFTFLRGLANTWSLTIPAAIFNNRCEALVSKIADEAVRVDLSQGRAYEHATAAYLAKLPVEIRDVVIDVLTEALKSVWYIAAICAGLALCLAVFEKDIPLRTKLEGNEKEVTDEEE
ncbi:hypothetical protein Daus18300_000114 [Diaporthe australafricana]|uniref:Major facilitator superfamily (MFS) profile domain-containing protein n=1 Tax=Diaporthe australafricana TaxID=127596 RepID=A0ABR3Y6T6_9PEZI